MHIFVCKCIVVRYRWAEKTSHIMTAIHPQETSVLPSLSIKIFLSNIMLDVFPNPSDMVIYAVHWFVTLNVPYSLPLVCDFSSSATNVREILISFTQKMMQAHDCKM